MFLKNRWYAAAMSGELGRALLARRILGEPLVLYRRENGSPAALYDQCPHRFAPLSIGKLVGDTIQCGYHGITFDGHGACVRVPAQPNIPPRLKARAFPVVEKWQWIWVWMGDPAEADEALIPDFHWNDCEGWATTNGYLHIEADHQLLVDNLMDLSHESYVHAGTIGTDHVAETPVQTRVDGETVWVERRMNDIPPPPMFTAAAGLKDNIDRWQIIEWHAPANVIIDVGAVPTGTNDRANGYSGRVLNVITPESERSTHYFWGFARDFRIDDAAVGDALYEGLVRTFNEDKAVLEAQQRMLDLEGSDAGMIAVNFDSGVIAVRKLKDRMLAAEGVA